MWNAELGTRNNGAQADGEGPVRLAPLELAQGKPFPLPGVP